MSAITTKVDVCNLALGDLGNRNTVTNIDTPKNDKEIICSLWYDITRQLLLKTMMPNFALNRLIVSQKTVPPGYMPVVGSSYGYAYAYEYPNRCLKLLGVGDVDIGSDNKPTIENGLIFSNTLYANGMPIRIVDDITDVTAMSPEFIITLAKEIAKRIALPVTQDQGKKKTATEDAAKEISNATALNAQENKPIRRSISRFRQARYSNVNHNPTKK